MVDSGSGAAILISDWFCPSEGKCAQFWFGGEGGNRNKFGDEADCRSRCVEPHGSAKCFLPK